MFSPNPTPLEDDVSNALQAQRKARLAMPKSSARRSPVEDLVHGNVFMFQLSCKDQNYRWNFESRHASGNVKLASIHLETSPVQ